MSIRSRLIQQQPSAQLCNEIEEIDPTFFHKNPIICDPAMGGGDFLKEVASRCKAAGQNRATILSRLVGCETNRFYLGYCEEGVLKGMKMYKLSYDKDSINKFAINNKGRFDCIVTNPPYNRGIYKDFLISALKMLKDGGTLAVVVNLTFAAGRKFKEFRKQFLSTCGIIKIIIKPAGTFKQPNGKDVEMVTCILIAQKGYKGDTTIVRTIDDSIFEYTCRLDDSEADIILHWDNTGREIWNICNEYKLKIPTNVHTPTGPNVHFASRLHLSYVAQLGKDWSHNFNGKRIVMGIVLNKDNNIPLPSTGKRIVINVSTPQEAVNVYKWIESKWFGVILSMTGVDTAVSNTNVGKMPLLIVDGVHTDEDLERIWAQMLGLTQKQVEWLRKFPYV